MSPEPMMRTRTSRRLIIAFASITCVFIFVAAFAVEIADGTILIRWHPAPKHPFAPHDTPTPAHDAARPGAGHGHGEERPANKDYRVLTSKRNNMGLYNIIDMTASKQEIYNPTLLELPRGSAHEFLVVGRSFHQDEEIAGVRYQRARQIAVFANLTYNAFGRPELTAGEWWTHIADDFNGPEHHCKDDPGMDQYIGPEDMKVFWTRKGAPLLIFTNQTPDEVLCEGMFIVDVRAAVKELEEALGRHALDLPAIHFKVPTPLKRLPHAGQEQNARYQREKNWAPFQSPLVEDVDELLFMVEPGQVFKYKSASEPVEEMETEKESAVAAPYPPDIADPAATWHSKQKTCVHDVMRSDSHVHQSTPMLSMTLCERGACVPNSHNTVLLHMVQLRYDPPPSDYPFQWYDHRIATYNASAPYKFRSVSRKLTYHGEEDRKYIWTGGMVYFVNRATVPVERSHGYLDDEIWLSFGVNDTVPGWIDVDARDLVADHYFCEGASTLYRDIEGFSIGKR